MGNNLEAQLARHLRPVAAPDDLWFRIQEPRHSHSGAVLRWPVWAFAAAVAATIALFCFNLARGVEDVEFRSTDPAQIRAWVRANAGIDIPLPARTGADVKLIGVSMVRSGSPLVCVTYRVGNQAARLLVTRTNHAAPSHASMAQGTSPATWMMQGQTYTLASSAPENARAACVLCHVGPRA